MINTDTTYCFSKDFDLCKTCYRNINLYDDRDKFVNKWFFTNPEIIEEDWCINYTKIKENKNDNKKITVIKV